MADSSSIPVSQWDFVPYQVINKSTKIGLLAFHKSGIAKVDFFLNGSKFKSIQNDLNRNASKSNYEFSFISSESVLVKGLNVFTALVYAGNGERKEVESIKVYYNGEEINQPSKIYISSDGSNLFGDGSYKRPYATISHALGKVEIGGEVVITKPGDYYLDGVVGVENNPYWTTITASRNLPRNSVTLKNIKREYVKLNFDKLKFSSVRIDFANIKMFYLEPNQSIWFDNVEWFDSNYNDAYKDFPPLSYEKGFNPVSLSKYIDGYFVTNSLAHHTMWGFVDARYVKNVEIHHVVGDALTNSKFVSNALVHDIVGNETGKHSDVYQLYGKQDNIIVNHLYGFNLGGFRFRAKFKKEVDDGVQNFFFGTRGSFFSNIFINDICIDNTQNVNKNPFSQLAAEMENITFNEVRITNQKWFLRVDHPESFKPRGVTFINSFFPGILLGKGLILKKDKLSSIEGVSFSNVDIDVNDVLFDCKSRFSN